MCFTTNAYPRERRRDEWRFALQRALFELVAAGEDAYGELVSLATA